MQSSTAKGPVAVWGIGRKYASACDNPGFWVEWVRLRVRFRYNSSFALSFSDLDA